VIPTAISEAERRFMRTIARGKSVVEFGALLGFSTVNLAQVASRLTSVDKHEGYGTPTLAPFMSNLDRYHVSPRFIQGEALEWASLDAELAFIDLTGQYDLTRQMLERLRAPFALVHDCHRSYCQVDRAIKDAGWHPISQVDTLVWCTHASL
jgi:predicted O-methyltransferase YrrM